MNAVRRSRGKRKRSLAGLTVEEFMRYSSSEGEQGEDCSNTLGKKPRSMVAKGRKAIATRGGKPKVAMKGRKTSLQQQVDRLKDQDPEFYQFLQDNDEKLLNYESDSNETGEESEDEEEDGGGGAVEPRPLTVTSYKQNTAPAEDEPSSSEEEEEDEGAGLEEFSGPEDEGGATKHQVTLAMVKKWTSSLTKTRSLHVLRKLCGSLHDAIASLLPQARSSDSTPPATVPASSDVFNALVLACFQCVPDTLLHYLPTVDTPSKRGHVLPSSQKAWRRVRGTVRQYLGDLLDLIGRLQSSAMRCSVLRQLVGVARYCVCFPKLLKKLTNQLVECWCGGDNHAQVPAFLCLHRLVLLQPHPALHILLKKLYLAFVSNCKFPSAAGVGSIEFMLHSLVELLAIDPPTSYQHAFVYIRQLAIHLRTAMTSGKKDSQQAVYNWQFVYCLKLWGVALCEVSDTTLRPLLYPLVQVVIGTIQLQPSAKYHPLRLHLVKILLQLSNKTDTYTPVAPYLLEVLEEHGVDGNKQLSGGKAGDMSLLLRASTTQLSTRSFKTALVNEAFQLLLQYLVAHSHYISFPELCFPTLVRLRSLCKSTRYSWLRAQLRHIIEKAEEICLATTRERLKVTFSPKDTDEVTSWENQRKGRETKLSKFLETWTSINTAAENTNTEEQPQVRDRQRRKVKTTPTETTLAKDYIMNSDNEGIDSDSDLVEDLELSDLD